MTTARSVRFFVNLGLGLVFYGVLVKCLSGALDLDMVLQLVHASHDTGHA